MFNGMFLLSLPSDSNLYNLNTLFVDTWALLSRYAAKTYFDGNRLHNGIPLPRSLIILAYILLP